MQPSSESYVRDLREDHARFSRVLSMIGRDARRLIDEPDAVLPLFAEAIDYVVNFQNVYHHPREEIMFAKIAAKSEQLKAAADRLSAEHAGTARAGAELLSLIDRSERAGDERAGRERLAKGLETFARSMRRHITQEEDLLYSQVWTELTHDDWRSLADSAAALDPLRDDPDTRYPLLSRYVREGRNRSNVDTESSRLGEVLAPVVASLSEIVDRFAAIDRTLKRQRKEACALTRKTIRDMPSLPLFEPVASVRVSVQSAGDLASAYGRWWREWIDLYRGPENREESNAREASRQQEAS